MKKLIEKAVYQLLEKSDYQEQAKMDLNPINVQKLFDGKAYGVDVANIISPLLMKQIMRVKEQYELPLIHPEYDDQNWYFIWGNLHEKVLQRIDPFMFENHDDYDFLEQTSTRCKGDCFYSIAVTKDFILGRCGLDRKRSRWILIADQSVFDNMDMDITR